MPDSHVRSTMDRCICPHTVGGHHNTREVFIQTVACGANAAIIAEGSFVQAAADDTWQVKSSAAGDTTQFITIFGVNTSNQAFVSTVKLNGATAVAIPGTASDTGRYFEKAILTAKCAGNVTIERSGGTDIYIIPIGQIESRIAHRFFVGDHQNVDGGYGVPGRVDFYHQYLTTHDADGTMELRIFTNIAAARDLTLSYVSPAAYLTIAANTLREIKCDHWLDRPRVVLPGSYVAAIGTGNGMDCGVRLVTTAER